MYIRISNQVAQNSPQTRNFFKFSQSQQTETHDFANNFQCTVQNVTFTDGLLLKAAIISLGVATLSLAVSCNSFQMTPPLLWELLRSQITERIPDTETALYVYGSWNEWSQHVYVISCPFSGLLCPWCMIQSQRCVRACANCYAATLWIDVKITRLRACEFHLDLEITKKTVELRETHADYCPASLFKSYSSQRKRINVAFNIDVFESLYFVPIGRWIVGFCGF